MDDLKPLIDALHGQGRLRIWSLVITVFGDAVQHRGGQISTVRLQRLLGRIGVEPGALRTALSRLGRDGWVMSERRGRVSIYRLSQTGVARFTDATWRIYAPPRLLPVADWVLALDGDARALQVGGLSLRPLGGDAPPNPALRLTGQLDLITPELRATLLSPDHRAALLALHRDLDHLPPAPDPLDALAARTLLVHRWRRIVLRFPDVPPELLPDGMACPRTRMADAYARLTPLAEGWLSQDLPGMSAMPTADASLARRFAQTA